MEGRREGKGYCVRKKGWGIKDQGVMGIKWRRCRILVCCLLNPSHSVLDVVEQWESWCWRIEAVSERDELGDRWRKVERGNCRNQSCFLHTPLCLLPLSLSFLCIFLFPPSPPSLSLPFFSSSPSCSFSKVQAVWQKKITKDSALKFETFWNRFWDPTEHYREIKRSAQAAHLKLLDPADEEFCVFFCLSCFSISLIPFIQKFSERMFLSFSSFWTLVMQDSSWRATLSWRAAQASFHSTSFLAVDEVSVCFHPRCWFFVDLVFLCEVVVELSYLCFMPIFLESDLFFGRAASRSSCTVADCSSWFVGCCWLSAVLSQLMLAVKGNTNVN